MTIDFKVGAPTKFNPENCQKIIDAIHEVIVLRHAAALAGISHMSVYNWVNQGKEDVENGVWSEHAQFFYNINQARAEEAAYAVRNVKSGADKWQSSAWILERCFREDFGQDAGIIQDLLAKCEKLEQDFKRISENPLQGGQLNG